MENWIQEISKTYISSFSPKRKDLVENYVSLNEEQKLELFSQNVHSYLQEQFKNAFGFDMNELSEEDKKSFLSVLFESKGAREVQARTGEATGDADASASLAGRSEELAKQMSGELKAKEEPQSAKEEPHWVATVNGTKIKVPIGHVVGTVKGGGTVMGPESHVVAAAPGRIKKIHRQPRPKK